MLETSSSIAVPTCPDAGPPWCNAENLDVIFFHTSPVTIRTQRRKGRLAWANARRLVPDQTYAPLGTFGDVIGMPSGLTVKEVRATMDGSTTAVK